MHKTCKNCGAMNAEGAQFCEACGKKLKSAKIFSAKYLASALVLVALLAGAGYFFFKNQSPDYFPLNAGMKWNYQYTDTTQPNETHVVFTNLSSRELNGKRVIPQQTDFFSNTAKSLATSFNFFYTDKEGVHIYAQQESNAISPRINGSDFLLIKYPIQAGTTWTNDNVITNSIESTDATITVPAGDFSNVIELKQTRGRETYVVWYAPKVGMVMMKYTDANGVQQKTAKLISVTN